VVDENQSDDDPPDPWPDQRSAVVRNAIGIGVATGAYGVSFGAISVAAGLTVAQTIALSLLMFTGASQFALVGVAAAGGVPVAGAATAVLLGARNTLYGLRLTPLLRPTGLHRLAAAHLVIDESAAVAIGQRERRVAVLGFWSTGLAVFVCWNLATVLGAVGADLLADPAALGLDAAVPAAFLALLAPSLGSARTRTVAASAAVVALAVTPFVPVGLPVLAAAGVAVVAGVVAPGFGEAQTAPPVAGSDDEPGSR